MRHLAKAGEFARQLESAGARRAVVDFLEQGDVGIMVANDSGDSFRPEGAVEADGAMDVVGEDADPQRTR